MREIKFRIWDNQKNEWLGESDEDTMTYYGFHLVGEVMNTQVPPVWALGSGNVVEQYTEFKDKNGKEIYEGDIVVASKDPRVAYSDKNQVVGFEDGVFIVDPAFTSLWYMAQFDIEIIGNIHQNPELLEGGSK